MELDVHLTRDGQESWGFRLIGGKDFKMPLTVVKVEPGSPAARAGLQNGDVVSHFNGADASEMSHDSAKQFVADATDTLELSVKRGLYDPVLDDYEPIYEAIDQDDFDQPSQPTEVDPFQIQQFLDSKPSREASELKDIEPGFTPLSNGLIDQSRSLTASPFVLSAKPYRPFSTEPLPIPPLEDPIILDPNYKDEFGKIHDGAGDEFWGLPETRFKLPISEQYDPDGTKKKRTERASSEAKGVKFAEESLKKDVTKESKFSEEIKIKTALEEKMMMEKMKREIDLDKIEMTAVSLVDESIERALSVADEIKKEIDVELHETSSTSKVESKSGKESTKISMEKTRSEYIKASESSKESSKETSELVDLIDKTTEEIMSYNGSHAEVSVSKEVQKIESLDKKEKVDERKISTKQEIEDITESGSVRRKSEVFEKKLDVKSVESSQKLEKPKVSQQAQAKIEDTKSAQEKSEHIEKSSKSAYKTSEKWKEAAVIAQKSAAKSDSKTKTDKQFAQQKAYKIGLQTIPNIKGTIHSSYHYNLLLKTFFIHLTDVMVALSRFILSEPVFSKTDESQEVKNVTTEQSVSEFKSEYVDEETELANKYKEQIVQKESTISERQQEVYESKKEENSMVVEDRVEKQEAHINAATQEKTQSTFVAERNYADEVEACLEVEQIIERQKLSGAQMAQVQERKSAELTHKMDAVISEFQTKAGIEESEVTRERRSRSRSQIEEEVARESDPLEWLSKADQQRSKEISEFKSESKAFSSITESVEKKRVESKHERREKSSKSKEGKQMYLAIVESHVFTNKDAIFEEQAAEFSETSSVQSADEINIALQASETLATENVSMESKEVKQEKAEILEESRKLSVGQTQLVQMVEEVISSNAIVEEVKEEKAIEVKEEIQKVEVKEEAHVMSVSEKTEVDISEMHESIAVQENKQEEYVAIKEEAIESVTKTKEIEVVAPVEVESVELKITKPAKPTPTLEEASAALKIVKEEVIEREQVLKLTDESELNVSKHTEISETDNQYSEVHKSKMECYESQEVVQESSFTATLAEQKSSLTIAEQKSNLRLDLTEERKLQAESSTSSVPSTINTPTPSTVPPTPLTDEYVFKLQIPLPKTTIDVPRDCTPTPEDEDPNIVKKKLIPYIDTTLESPVIYDPPLPTPPEDKVQSPVYTKPGLKGGAFTPSFRWQLRKKEEILEIERKSSLLASAIDETIKSIEEYKEEVGIETKKELKEETKIEQSSKSFEEHTVSKKEVIKTSTEQPIIYNGYAKVETKVYNNVDHKIEQEWSIIDEQVKETNDKLVQLSNGFDVKENGVSNGIESEVEVKVTYEKSEDKKEDPTEPEQKAIAVSKAESNIEEALPVKSTVKFEMDSDKTENTVTSNEITDSEAFEEVSRFNIKPMNEVVSNGENPGDVSAAFVIEPKRDPMEGYRPVQFNPEELVAARRGLQSIHLSVQEPAFQRAQSPSYVSSTGELLGTHQGIVDGLEEAVVDEEVAKELGKPGMTEEKIAELISGESEMLREAHVMGVDFKKIKPIIESLKDSEVLKALNDELIRTAEEKKKEEEKKWTTFLQKPKRPVPKAKFGYGGYIQEEEKIETPYTVKIVKQPKPKVAPDYKQEDFDTGPLPWEERALHEPPPPPVEPEDPILIPEEVPEFLEAVDPLPESEVPDLEDTGIPLPPPKQEEEPIPSPVPLKDQPAEPEEEEPQELDLEAVVEETNEIVKEMEQNRLAEQLMMGVQSMVDPNASIEQQLAQMRAQVAALAQLPGVIQQTLDLVTRQLSQLSQQESHQVTTVSETQSHTQMQKSEMSESHEYEVTQNNCETIEEESNNVQEESNLNEEHEKATITEIVEETKPSLTQEELEKLRKEEEEMLEEQRRIEKQKKIELLNEVWPWGNEKYCRQYRINFMKYEKPPVSLDHLQHSDVYKLIHNMEQEPLKRVEMRTPVIAESDYREKCRSVTPCGLAIV